jgi:hypothetical protein
MIVLLARLKVEMQTGKVVDRLDRAKRRNLRRQSRDVHRRAKRLIKRRKSASLPGDPFHSKSGNARRSLRYKVGRSTAWIGGTMPKGAHLPLLKHGTKRMEPRPVLEPALEASRAAMPEIWKNSL